MTEIVAVTGEDFTGAAHCDGTAISAWLKGNADYAALDALEMLLARSHAEAIRVGATAITVDLCKLEFMNSSCFKCLLSWITDIQELELERRYKVRFLSNPQLHWQKRSLHSLRCFAVELITVEEA
ncbi:MAG: hypothetical protein ABI867_07470 [Kofleriaceae bacterium]